MHKLLNTKTVNKKVKSVKSMLSEIISIVYYATILYFVLCFTIVGTSILLYWIGSVNSAPPPNSESWKTIKWARNDDQNVSSTLLRKFWDKYMCNSFVGPFEIVSHTSYLKGIYRTRRGFIVLVNYFDTSFDDKCPTIAYEISAMDDDDGSIRLSCKHLETDEADRRILSDDGVEVFSEDSDKNGRKHILLVQENDIVLLFASPSLIPIGRNTSVEDLILNREIQTAVFYSPWKENTVDEQQEKSDTNFFKSQKFSVASGIRNVRLSVFTDLYRREESKIEM